jgi:hypothetical protein
LHENARKCSYFIDPIHFREFLEIFHFSPISNNKSQKMDEHRGLFLILIAFGKSGCLNQDCVIKLIRKRKIH